VLVNRCLFIPAVEHSGATQLTVQIKRRRRLMWGEGEYSSTHVLRCKHQNPVSWKNSETTGEGCSCRGLPELSK